MTYLISFILGIGLLITGSPGHATGDIGAPPPHCEPWPTCQYQPCPDPSGICPPYVSGIAYQPSYIWQGTESGTQSVQEFAGSSLPSGWFAQSTGTPGGCTGGCRDTWSASNVSVSGGIVAMTDTCGASSCTAGGIGQSSYGFSDSSQIAVAARIVGGGEHGSNWVADNVLQLGEYGQSWPPEVDFAENGGGSSVQDNFYINCWTGGSVTDSDADGETLATGDTDNDGDMQQVAEYKDEGVGGLNVGEWNVYEVDWTPTRIAFYVYNTVSRSETFIGSYSKDYDYSYFNGVRKYYDTACDSHWPPSPGAAMGLFFQSQIVGMATPPSGTTETTQVDWVAALGGSV